MYDYKSEYEPREMLFETLGMVEAMRTMETNESKQDALDDVAHNIKWVLKNALIFKNMEVKKDE